VKKWIIVGAVALVLFIVACGFGGYSLLRSFQDSAKNLEPEFARATSNGIPLTLDALRPERTLAPGENAALEYKKAFDEWVKIRPEISDERWESYLAGKVGADEKLEIDTRFNKATVIFEEASTLKEAQWNIDYSARAFDNYPIWAGLVDVHHALVRRQVFGDNPSKDSWASTLEERFAAPNHVLQSADPGSLRTAASMRMDVLSNLADAIPYLWLGIERFPDRGAGLKEILDAQEPIDPLPVWRTTAFLQFNTWDSYEKLTNDQKTLFAGARRDDGVMLDAASTEILKFWDDAIEASVGKPELVQYTTLGEMVLRLRERTDLAAVPLKQLWTLDSATKGAGSLDWILANEQLMIMKQVMDVIVASNGQFPEKFDCKRVSVIGMKPYTYERTAAGFKISAKPSDVLAPQSALANQSLVYEFKELR
jgi:hypothetical protein